MRFKIGDNVDHILHGHDFIIKATKDIPYNGNKVPEGSDYLIVKRIPGEFSSFLPVVEDHLDPRE